MQLYRKDNNKFEINFSAFHSTYEVDTPMHSVRQLDEQERQREAEGLDAETEDRSAQEAEKHESGSGSQNGSASHAMEKLKKA